LKAQNMIASKDSKKFTQVE